MTRALARILKLPAIFLKDCLSKMIQNGLRLYNTVQNGHIFAHQKEGKLPVKMMGLMSPSSSLSPKVLDMT